MSSPPDKPADPKPDPASADDNRTVLDPDLLRRVKRQEHASERAADPGESAESSAPSLSLEPGLTIDQYELIRELGRGGMGRVFMARDTRLGRRVAIKFLHRSSPGFNRRFLDEARTTARCSHENIVVIHEVAEHQGHPFMVLEYLAGETLRQMVKGQPLAPTRAVEVMIPVVRALARAHEHSIVHRDLKPDNIIVQTDGAIKVLDFGIAKLFDDAETGRAGAPGPQPDGEADAGAGEGVAGTLCYMAPEQWGSEGVDARADLWAVGVIIYELLVGENPLAGRTPEQLLGEAALLDVPLPSIKEAAPQLPPELVRLVDRCLRKPPEERYASAADLLGELNDLRPERQASSLATDESPYPGLRTFTETDAGRFFGRSRDVLRTTVRLVDIPLVAVVGPSGVGKSSFVRAGVLPSLRRSGQAGELLVTRPGRRPLAALARLLRRVEERSPKETEPASGQDLESLLREAPGVAAHRIRALGRQLRQTVVVFVDQFEELYTQGADPAERAAFTACLTAMADDASAPVRVLLTMRSDFLDRAAEDQRFVEEVTRGLVFLQPPDPQGLRDALIKPADMAGYRFESAETVDEMLEHLGQTPNALPLLQFAASKLWESRDPAGKLLPRAAYERMGGITGALATHADEALAALSSGDRRVAKQIFMRLVTGARTRATVDIGDMADLAPTPRGLQRIIDYLVERRLLVIQSRGDEEGPAVELVHESLIEGWPALRRWLDETAEDKILHEQLQGAAGQWQDRGRPAGLLWSGDVLEDARRWQRRREQPLGPVEREFLQAAFHAAGRARRFRRMAVVGTISLLTLLVVVTSVGLVWIRDAQQEAKGQAKRATTQAREAAAARQRVKQQYKLLLAETQRAKAAVSLASKKEKEAALHEKGKKMTQAELHRALVKLTRAKERLEKTLKRIQAERTRALAETRKAKAATARAEKLAAAEREATRKLDRQLKRQKALYRALKKSYGRIGTLRR